MTCGLVQMRTLHVIRPRRTPSLRCFAKTTAAAYIRARRAFQSARERCGALGHRQGRAVERPDLKVRLYGGSVTVDRPDLKVRLYGGSVTVDSRT